MYRKVISKELKVGMFVADLDRVGLAETFELRIAFEGMAIRLATHNVPAPVAANALPGVMRGLSTLLAGGALGNVDPSLAREH